MDAKLFRFLLAALFFTTAIAGGCIFDRFSDDTADTCPDIKFDTKKTYKEGEHKNLELHVRFCQICAYNCDLSMDNFTDVMKNVTEACNSDEGCTKRYISWKGCPHWPSSEYFKKPKCFFDDDLTKIADEPCDDIGDDVKEGEDPATKWDAKHKYDLLRPPNDPKFQRELRFLLKNAFEDVCSFPNTFDVVGAIIGALMCIFNGCTKRYMGWRLCPADADHALFGMTIEVGGAAAIADFLNKMAETFGRLVDGEAFGDVNLNFTMLDGAFNITETLRAHGYNMSDVGRLLCNGKPIKKAMRLVAKVGPPGFDGEGEKWLDGLYENEATDDGTFFRVSGWVPACNGASLGGCYDIEPHLDVFHRCNQKLNPTNEDYHGNLVNLTHSDVIHFYIKVPAEYVYDGKVPAKIWDMGTYDLANTEDSKDGEIPYWFNGGEVEGGCMWIDRSLPAVAYCSSDKHEEIPKWKYEEFP